MKFTPQLLNRLAGWKAVKEGRQLYDLGKVSEVSLDGTVLRGVVRAGPGGVLRVRLKTGLREVDFENHCPCPAAYSSGGEMCPHAMALAWAFIEQTGAGQARAGSAAAGLTKAGEQGQVFATPAMGAASGRMFDRVSFDEADDRTPTLALRVILPPRLGETSAGMRVQPLVEASLDGGDYRALPAVLKRIEGMVALSQADERLVAFLETAGGLPGQTPMLDAAGLDSLLNALREHPEVWLGRERRVEVAGVDEPREVRLSAPADDRIDVEVVGGTSPGRRLGAWLFDGTTLRRQADTIEGLLGPGRLSLVGEKARRFVEETLLREQPGISWVIDESFERRVRLIRSAPRIRLELDGTLDNLQARLFAMYEGVVAPIPPSGRLFHGVRQPDPSRLEFLIADPAAEEDARARLLNAGFLPGRHDTELFVLPGESLVMPFLANLYPDLKRDWEVHPSGRFGEAISRAEWLRPTLDIQEWEVSGAAGRAGAAGIDWFATVSFESGSGRGGLSYSEAFNLLNRGRAHVWRPDGTLMLVRKAGFEELQESLADFDARQERPGALRFSKRHTLALTGLLASGEVALKKGSRWAPPQTLSKRVEIGPPETLKAALRPYQLEGFRWLAWLSDNELAGILADEMGLGKTVQALAWLLDRRERCGVVGHCLVVCPGSLMFNWMEEAQRFAPSLDPTVYYGPERWAAGIGQGRGRLWITSYGILRRDVGKLAEVSFDSVVLDEAQQIKNPSGKAAVAVRSLRSACRLALSGTPVENRPLDLWSIFEFLMPGYLGRERDFLERYGRPAERSGEGGQAALARLSRRVRPFIMRRTKSAVTPDLPERVDREVKCPMSPLQRELHASILEAARRGLSDLAGEKDQGRRRMFLVRALLRLRQVCCHPRLLPGDFLTGQARPSDGVGLGAEEGEFGGDSGKLAAFIDLLDEALASGQRLLVFSQFTSMLAILRAELNARGIRFCYLDGGTRDRATPVHEFQTKGGPPVFLISLKAGGTGLNLTAADHVVLFDPWWNPAVEEQAAARAHRIGRRGMVTVHRLIAAESIEIGVLQLQQRKRSMTESLVGFGDAAQGLSTDEIEELLRGS